MKQVPHLPPDPHLTRRHFIRNLGYGAAAWYLLPSDLQAQPSPPPTAPPANFGSNTHYPSNKAPFRPTPYVALPLGSIRPQGWLLKQLHLQADGLTGHAEELPDWLPALQNSAWTGGAGENWEKGPYYVKGLVSLAYVLDDDRLKKKAQVWIDGMLASRREDGSFGPANNTDWWPRMVATYILRDYHEATQDPRVLPLLTGYCAYMTRNLPHRPLDSWSKARAADQIDTIIWLYNRTGDASLVPLARLLRQQAFDWPAVYRDDLFLQDEMLSHGVNISQALKSQGEWHLLSVDTQGDAAIAGTHAPLMRHHGLILGISSGTEHVAGKSPSQGVETCSTVERMLSDETNLRIFGDPELGDNLERLAFNALPAALSDTIRQHVYYTTPNRPVARLAPHGFWEDYPDGILPAPRSGYPCCCYNFHMGWPKYLQNSWAATHDNGLAVFAYGPSQVTAKVGPGTEVTMVQDTAYPFDDTLHFRLFTPQPVSFPLELRLPAWCQSPRITVGGQAAQGLRPGTFFRLERLWHDGDEVTVQFPMEIRANKGYLQTVALERGPLIYSLAIEAEKKILQAGHGGFDQFELTPKTPWNYALDLDPDQLGNAVSVQQAAMPENPYVAETTPVRLTAPARRLPEWSLARNGVDADDPPYGPVASTEAPETISLIPFGAQFLRITQFPYIGTPPIPPTAFHDDFTRDTFADEWGLYGSGWYRENGRLCCRSQLPSKALVLGSAFTQLVYEARISVPDQGHAGLLFRITKPGFGDLDFNGYYAGISAETHAVFLGKSNGTWTELKRATLPIMSDQSHLLRITATDAKLAVYFEKMDAPVIELEDATYVTGAIGVRQVVPRYTIPSFATLSARVA